MDQSNLRDAQRQPLADRNGLPENKDVSPLRLTVCLLACGLLTFVTGGLLRAAEPTAAVALDVDFSKQIAPLLQKYCSACHNDSDESGELSFDTFEALLAGGEHGPVVVPGEPENSPMLLTTTGEMEPKMPPDDFEGPTGEEIELLRRWIAAGANGPNATEPSMRELKTPQIPAAETTTQPITALARSADGSLLAIARFGQVELRRADRDSVPVHIESLPGKVNDLRFSDDDSRLVIASGITGLQGTAMIVNVANGEVEQTVRGHRDTLYAAALSPAGDVLATAGYDRNLLLWDANSGEQMRVLTGHNGAIFDLAFSPDGQVIATASADETVKLWQVSSGNRLDTLAQSQGEVNAVAFSPDGKHVVAASADNRFRVWEFVSRQSAQTNPLVETRFADDSPLVSLAFSGDGGQLIVATEAGRLLAFETKKWTKLESLASLEDAISQLAISAKRPLVSVATMSGEVRELKLAEIEQGVIQQAATLSEVYLTVDPLRELSEPAERGNQTAASAMELPRGAVVSGVISAAVGGASEADWYRFSARRGEVWMIETRAAQDASPLDTIIEVCDEEGQSLTRARLQAIRESYFTFRGKDSNQTSDFRLFDWEEMRLNDLLYSSGEVTRLWMYPRGPDSGFNVYPGTGSRHTFYDTSAVTHALQEPAYVVRELAPNEPATANGLPVFELNYRNDDDAARQIGADSRLRFVAPRDGNFTIRVDDTRGQAGDDYKYKLTVRPAAPDFRPSVGKIGKPIPAGAGREFRVSITRLDGFQGAVAFTVVDLPPGLHATETVTVEAGQQDAYGVIWADDDVAADQTLGTARLVARAEIVGRVVEHQAGDVGELKTSGKPQVRLEISNQAGELLQPRSSPLPIKRGQTISAEVMVQRNAFENDLKLGNEFAGRNMPHGVYVDNIGLNGLLVPKGYDRRQFFITADPVAAPGPRYFHLKAEIDGGITSTPILLEVE
ncbi:c-type cytochrome domain-containing protein [Planctomycetaceae bacterium SH139]